MSYLNVEWNYFCFLFKRRYRQLRCRWRCSASRALKLCQSFYELADYHEINLLLCWQITYLKYCSSLIFNNLLKTLAELPFLSEIIIATRKAANCRLWAFSPLIWHVRCQINGLNAINQLVTAARAPQIQDTTTHRKPRPANSGRQTQPQNTPPTCKHDKPLPKANLRRLAGTKCFLAGYVKSVR